MEAYQREAKDVVAQSNEMRKEGKVVRYSDFSNEVNRRMRVYNATMRISRIELLKSQIGVELTKATAQTDVAVGNKLSTDYISELKRQAGIMEVTARPSMWTGKKVAKTIMAQTNSATFSQRIWANQDALKARLDQVIANGVIQGQSPVKMARMLKDQVRTTVTNQRYVTERIARTESARVQYTAQIESIKKNGYQYVRWFAEPKACIKCASIARQDNGYGAGIYKIDKVPRIPDDTHPNCRCSISETWVEGKDDNISIPPYKNVKKYFDRNIPYIATAYALSVIGKTINGKPIQYRTYGEDGRPVTDYDLTDHGFPKYHPVVPHAHDWIDDLKRDGVKYMKRGKWRRLTDTEIDTLEGWEEQYDKGN